MVLMEGTGTFHLNFSCHQSHRLYQVFSSVVMLVPSLARRHVTFWDRLVHFEVDSHAKYFGNIELKGGGGDKKLIHFSE